MKKLLMKFKVNMLFVVILSLVAGMAGNYFFDNRWLGLIIALPLCALYIYQVYQVQAETAVIYGKVMFFKRKASKTPAENIPRIPPPSRTSAVFSKCIKSPS